ncbi:MAG: selenide, water dikinase SelD [Deltaproteobacteria bacterium RIFOXYA12_FULL_58_15]|nr:MAG: selenide, water dikinase SelD [Deltaproteobacteria bacterium RIFOXYA12_FULL_58_15]OGR09966.1 MAG: selenide, water dikinase SelD [Deltaproteobacteria bacterium RIFOXYB12_FULL_58_9]
MPKDERIITSFANAEDAAVYRISDDRALVFTQDVITPLVDDPVAYGAIAATNSLSDIFAMGGKPIMSLGFIGVPNGVPIEIIADIERGGAETALAAGAPVLGGHSIECKDLIYGLAVIGEVHPDRVFRNDALRIGDQLILTKPLGTATLTTAAKNDALSESELSEVIAGMRMSNGPAVDPMQRAGVRAATDITGFGLLGHAAEQAAASGVCIVLNQTAVPAYSRAREMLERGFLTRGNKSNQRYAESLGPVAGEPELLLRDPQTSGGLLAAVRPGQLETLLKELRALGFPHASHVGEVVAGAGLRVIS